MAARVSLVLGSGGPVGHAFHCGVLHAIADVTGWDPRDASLVVGTSAGAQVAALLRARVSAADLTARVSGRAPTAAGAEKTRWYVRPSHDPKPRAWHAWRPSSTAYLLRVLRSPSALRVGSLYAAFMPDGHVSLTPQADGIRKMFDHGWPSSPLWITAADLHTGDRIVFGRSGAPVSDVGTAVACSGAVPGLCEPITVGGHTIVDGGILSATHADLVDEVDDDLAIVSAPLSVFPPLRLSVRWRLRRRARPVMLVEPDRATCVAMGRDVMDLSRAPHVAEVAFESTRRRLREGSLVMPL